MYTATRLICCIVGMSATLVVAPVFPNGRTSPLLADMVLVRAICEDRSDGSQHEILRARVVSSDGVAKPLDVRVGTASEQLGISRIKSMKLPSDISDSDGFMSAAIIREDDQHEMAMMVQVGSAKSPLRLVGFTSDGSSISVDLSQCKKVDFTRMKSADDFRNRSEKGREAQ